MCNHQSLETSLDELKPDKGAYYTKELSLDLATVQPHVSGYIIVN